MSDVIPSFLDDGSGAAIYDGNAWGNTRLRLGEVQEIIPPTDPRNANKRVHEYRIFVQHVSNGTAVTKMYDHCILANPFGGLADKLVYTLRTDPSAGRKTSSKAPGPGVGSKVLILCVNGNHHNAVIIGGIRDAKDVPDSKDEGHHLDFEFNGVKVSINQHGELTLAVRGPTNAEGKVTEEIGSTIKVEKTGNVTLATKDNSIVIDQASGKIEVKANDKVVVNAPKIELGGEDLNDLLHGVLNGSTIEPITGKTFGQLGQASRKVLAKK